MYLHWSSAVPETSGISNRDKEMGMFALVYVTNPLHLNFVEYVLFKQTPLSFPLPARPRARPPASFDLLTAHKPESPLEKVTQLWRMTKSGASEERREGCYSGKGEEQAPFFCRSTLKTPIRQRRSTGLLCLMLHQFATEKTKRFESVFQE